MTKPEPVGWWCEKCEMQFPITPGNINHIPPAEHGWPSPIAPLGLYNCKGKLVPYYTSTQVRQAWEEFAGELDISSGSHGCDCPNEARRRAKEF